MKHLLSIVFFFSLLSVKAEVKIPRLSPLPVHEKRVELSGDWLFNNNPQKEFWKQSGSENWKAIKVPGEWLMQGFTVEKGQEAAYKRIFILPENWDGKRIKLRCNGIYSDSRIFINGTQVGNHLGGFTAFEIDVTNYVTIGKKNEIAVGVRSESVADSLASGSQYAIHQLGGITRDLFLFPLATANLSSFHVKTTFDKDYKNADLTAQVEIANENLKEQDNLQLQFTLKDPSGKEVKLSQSTYKLAAITSGSKVKKSVTFAIKEPKKWDSEHPHLYTLSCTLVKGVHQEMHQAVRKVGFRQIEVRGNQVFVNNMPIKLRGVCRHEVMPLRGRSVNNGMWRKDVEIFKRGNVNYIRTSHYPPDEQLLEACDELGMFVEVEAPFCWAHNTKVAPEDMYAALVNQHLEMVNRDRSHPSVLIWSMGNESTKFVEYFKKASDIVHEIDPTRPRIFSQWGPDSDGGALEIGNHHYPGPTGPDKYRNAKRPIVFDEYCHLNAYNRLELASDPGVRDKWNEILDKMYSDMYHSQGVLGGAIWAGIDDTFFLPNGKTVGYGTWGPIDGWRREKPEFWGMKKAYSPVKIMLDGNTNSKGEVSFSVENRYNFTNLSEITIAWETEHAKGVLSPEVAARQKSTFVISLPEAALKDTFMKLVVMNRQEKLVDEYKYQLLPEPILTQKVKTKKVKYKETESAFVFHSLSGTYRVHKNNGMLDYMPTLMLLPLNSEGRGIQMTGEGQNFDPYNPRCTQWRAEKYKVSSTDAGLKLQVYGAYKEAKGSFTYLFCKDGKVQVDYDFILREPVSPRQVGVVFTLAADYDLLAWKRKGYWSVYPENHIAALQGTAKAMNSELPISSLAGPSKKPSCDWSKDQTKAGSNVFRSTKENIYEASLTNSASGAKWQVQSDGLQSLRAWKEGSEIKVLVADYINAGREGFNVPFAKKEYRPLKKGDSVKGSIIFIRK